MQLEDYFDFLAPDDIRIKGHRIGIEIVLFDYLDGHSAEEIAARYRTLNLEEVYATLTYYWHNQVQVDAYLHAAEEHEAQMRAEQARHPSPGVQRVMARIAARRRATVADAA